GYDTMGMFFTVIQEIAKPFGATLQQDVKRKKKALFDCMGLRVYMFFTDLLTIPTMQMRIHTIGQNL
ncbi:hypothetical protein ACJX0J_037446, partial [Zea mays]